MVEPTNQQLMKRFRDGDSNVFDALFERFAKKVRTFLLQMVGDTALAEDLTQVTFVSIIRSRDRYQPGAPVESWIFSIALNAARDALRRRSVEKACSSELTYQLSRDEPPVSTDPGLRRELNHAFQQLPISQREAVLLHDVQGLPFEEVARMLGITSTAARIRAHRGCARLRELLAHLEGTS